MSNLKNRQMMQNVSDFLNKLHSTAKSAEKIRVPTNQTRVLRSGGRSQGFTESISPKGDRRSQSEIFGRVSEGDSYENQPTAEKVSEEDSRENAQSVNTSNPSTTPDEYQQTRYNTRSRSRAFTTPISAKPAATPSAPVKSCDSSIHAEESDNYSESSEYCDDDDDDEDYQPVNLSKQFRKEILDVRIDFAEASRAWRANKVSIGEGQFAYK
jgi:hypothetical protein